MGSEVLKYISVDVASTLNPLKSTAHICIPCVSIKVECTIADNKCQGQHQSSSAVTGDHMTMDTSRMFTPMSSFPFKQVFVV